jgi:hypothetical protein
MIYKQIAKIILFVVLIVVSFFYSLMFGYYQNGYLHGGQFMGIPFFLIFSVFLYITLFKSRLFKFFIGPTVIYALIVVGYTEYAQILENRLGSNWHEYMFIKNHSDIILHRLYIGGLIIILIYEFIIFRYFRKARPHNMAYK